MPELSQLEPFEIKGEWWRPDGVQLVKQRETQEPRSEYGLHEGMAVMQRPRDPLVGVGARPGWDG